MGDTVKRLAVLGSTGSVGQQTLDVIRSLPHRFRVVGLAAGRNISLLEEQINEFKPEFVYHQNVKNHSANVQYELLPIEDIACHSQVDTVVIATSGKSGLTSTLAAARAGKDIALANKESLVMAGEIITKAAKDSKARILPVDSEHSAIWQCLNGESQPPARLILTASGGPFRHYSPVQLSKVSAEQALSHPTWQMSKKVTIDSASLMNKGLEVIEAHWLFDMPFTQIDVLIHPQSIVHSMVEFVDGSIKAQIGYPDMRLPIQYALSHPERLPNSRLPKIEWSNARSLTFEQPDLETFPCLKIAIEAGEKRGSYPAVLCAADEVAVELFLSQRISFTDIPKLVEQTLNRHQSIAHPAVEEIFAADNWARQEALKLASGENL